MVRAFLGLLLSCALLGMATSAPADPILVNGSFEIGPVFSIQDLDILPGSTEIPGWMVVGGGVDLLGAPWDVSDGVHAIDLDRRSPGGIEQTFATTIGQTYQVSFDLSGNPGNGQPGTGLPTIKQLRVSVGAVGADYTFDSSGLSIAALVWQPIAFFGAMYLASRLAARRTAPGSSRDSASSAPPSVVRRS
jgi:hypothetical protein